MFAHGKTILRHTEVEVESVAGHRVLGREVEVCFRYCARCGWSRVAGVTGRMEWVAQHTSHGLAFARAA